MNFCCDCGQAVAVRIPEGDHAPRHVCDACGAVHYRNPKIIVGCIPEWQDRILMCRRAIQPRLGLWTFPAGFMELGETTAEGAAREALEESKGRVEVGELFVVINVPDVGQVYMIHRARLLEPAFGPTHESSEVVLMREGEIPWDQIAFRTILHSLRHFYADRAAGRSGQVHAFDLPGRRPYNSRGPAPTGPTQKTPP
jgi:ADP-ribose pyrophosphatase YjhB (NUDIX family)